MNWGIFHYACQGQAKAREPSYIGISTLHMQGRDGRDYVNNYDWLGTVHSNQPNTQLGIILQYTQLILVVELVTVLL